MALARRAFSLLLLFSADDGVLPRTLSQVGTFSWLVSAPILRAQILAIGAADQRRFLRMRSAIEIP